MKFEVFWKNPGYKKRPELKKDIECDYLIVGGGITGVSLAYFLSKAGVKNIVLIEKDMIAGGATGKAAGSIVLKGELDLKDIIAKYGEEKGKRFWEANHHALNHLKEIIKHEKINCDFDMEDTVFGNAKHKIDPYILEEYIMEKDIERFTELIVGKKLKQTINTPLFEYAMLSHDQAISLNPLKFTQNLSKKISKKSVSIYENTPLIKLHKNLAITKHNKIKFKHVILAMDAEMRNSKIKKLVSTIIITERLSNTELKKISLKQKKVIWDSKFIYHYLKITKDNRILLGYGDKNVHKKHASINPHPPHLKSIKSFLHKLFPHLHAKIEYAWSGSFGITKTKFPIVEKRGNKIIIGGAASQLSCLMASQYLADKIIGKKSKLEEFFKK